MLVRVKDFENLPVGGKVVTYLLTHLRIGITLISLKYILGETIHEHLQVCEEFGTKHNSEKQECYAYPGAC